MIKIANATPTTQQFLDDICDTTWQAQDLGGPRAKAILKDIAAAVAKRDIANAGSSVDPAGIQLTDEQWSQLHRKVRLLASGPTESY